MSSNHKLFKSHEISPVHKFTSNKTYTNLHQTKHTQIYIKQNIHKYRTQFFAVSPLLKKHIRLGHAGIVDHFVDLSIPDFKKYKEFTEAIKNIKKILYKYVTQIPVPYGSALHIPSTNLLLLAAKQESHKKPISL